MKTIKVTKPQEFETHYCCSLCKYTNNEIHAARSHVRSHFESVVLADETFYRIDTPEKFLAFQESNNERHTPERWKGPGLYSYINVDHDYYDAKLYSQAEYLAELIEKRDDLSKLITDLESAS